MERKPQVTLRLEAKELNQIRKAAKMRRRSVNQFVLFASLDAAKAAIENEKKPVANPEQREATA